MKKKENDELLEGMPEPEQDNSKKIKFTMGVAVVLFVVFIVLLLGSVLLKKAATEGQIVFPYSGLSQSIFESQNGSYVQNESLPFVKTFELAPYYIDVPSDKTATVDAGTAYTITDTDFAFVTEYENKNVEMLPNMIAEQLGKAYVLELNLDNCFLQENENSREEGFLNGYAMTYVTYTAQFADSNNNGYVVYILGYNVELNDDVSAFFAVSTATGTTDSLAYYKQWLDAMAYTLRYDEALNTEREELKAQEKAAKAQEEEEAAKAEEAEKEELEEKAAEEEGNNAESYYNQWYESQHETVDMVADGTGTQKIDVETESRYKNAVFRFTFTNPSSDFAYHFVDPEGNTIEMTDLTVSGENELTAVYNVNDSKKGVYSIVFDQGGCTYTTPALIIDNYIAYTSTELMTMEMQENNENAGSDEIEIPQEESGTEAGTPVVEIVPVTE